MKSNKRKLLSKKNTKNYYTLKSLKKKNKPNKSLVKQKYMKGGGTGTNRNQMQEFINNCKTTPTDSMCEPAKGWPNIGTLVLEGYAGNNDRVQRCNDKNIFEWLKIIHGCYDPFNIDGEDTWTYTNVGRGRALSGTTIKSSTHCIQTFNKWEETLNKQLDNAIEKKDKKKIAKWIVLAKQNILDNVIKKGQDKPGVSIPSESKLFLPSGYILFNYNNLVNYNSGNKNEGEITNINILKEIAGDDFNNLIKWAEQEQRIINESKTTNNLNLNLNAPKLALIVPQGNDTLDYTEITKFIKKLFDPIEAELKKIYSENNLMNGIFTNNIKLLKEMTER